MKDLNIVIFGATGGIGSALAIRLARAGCQLTLAGRNMKRLESLGAELNAEICSVDAADPEAIDRCLRAAAIKRGRLDGVVNCIGSLLLKPAHLTTDSEWADTISRNLSSSFFILRSAVRHMMELGGGSIVLLSSAAARRGMINHEAIAAAKAGIEGMALSAAASCARMKIRVNCVAPGLIRTPLTASLIQNERSLAASEALHPLGRAGEPAEVASAIEWLLSPEQCWVTGQVLGVDGGLSSVQPRVVQRV